jgi:dienelactone hydrolase
MTARPLYIDAGGESVLAFLHPPEREPWSGTGVLIVPPFGWEETASYRARAAWANGIAAAGHAVLRIDLPATGDSAGEPRAPGRLDAWVGAVDAGARYLEDAGALRVAALGMGLGASLAVAAAARGAPLTDLVLWATASRGRGLVRSLRAFAALQENADDAAELAPGGHLVSAATRAELEALDLTALDLTGPEGRRALLLGRDRPPRDDEFADHLRACGWEVGTGSGAGYAEMTAAPDTARVPEAVAELVLRRLPAPGGGAFAPPPARDELALGAVRESPLAFAAGGSELFGILAEPAGEARDTTLVLLSAGAIRRSGPNRMWVEAARRWAARGVPALRLDVGGIGDAAGQDARDADVSLYVPAYTDQVREALDRLAERGLPPRFVLAGLCSGAYWALHVALADERVAGAILLNPRLLVWDADLVRAREARRVLAQGRGPGWQRALRGPWSLDRARRVAASVTGAAWTRLTGRAGGAGAIPEVSAIAGSRARFALAFSGDEPLRDEIEASGALARLLSAPNVALHELPGRDHTLKPLSAQRAAHAVLDAELEALVR